MTTGPKAALEAMGGTHAALAAADARSASAGSQLSLLDEAREAERVEANLPLAPSPEAKRGPGRPPGARNRRTLALSYYVSRYGDPVEALLALGMGSLTHTAMEIHRAITELKAAGVPIARDVKGRELSGIDVGEVLKIKRAALEAVLPYIHAKLAPVDERGDPVVPVLAIGAVRSDAAAALDHARRGGAIDIESLIDITPEREDESVTDQGLDEGEA